MATKYDKDYQALIDKEVAAGNYAKAAEYEQLRNEKITSQGLDYATTNKYAGWLDKTDYGTVGKQQMASGADWQDVLETYENRYNKAATTEGLTQYANDDLQKEMWAYITENMNKPGFDLSGYTSSKPTYSSQYQTSIDALLQQILNRDSFSYDVAAPVYKDTYSDRINAMISDLQNRKEFSYNAEADPLYQQYKTQYQREGNRSMNDTLASVASGAGGMNSWAVTAAQQANDYYMAQLNDKIPELAQLAYNMYVQDFNDDLAMVNLLRGQGETEYNRYRDQYGDYLNERNYAYQQYLNDIEKQITDLGLLQDMDNTQYDRYRDTMSDWRDDLNFAYGQYRDEVGDYQWDTEFDFKVDQADKEWDYTEDRDEIEDGRYDKEWGSKEKDAAWNRAMEIISSGTPLTLEQLKAAGLTEDQAASMLALAKAANNMDLYGNPNGYVPEGDDDGDNVGGNPGGDDNKHSGGVGYNNGTLTADQVAKMQSFYGIAADGKWGPQSEAELGMSADAAWAEYQRRTGGSPEPDDDAEVSNPHGDSWIHVQGLGRLTWMELEDYVDSGKIKESKTSDGKYKYTLAK